MNDDVVRILEDIDIGDLKVSKGERKLAAFMILGGLIKNRLNEEAEERRRDRS